MRAPAARAPARQGASAAAGWAVSARARQPAVVGSPAMSMRSLTASRGPVAPGSGSSRRMKVADVAIAGRLGRDGGKELGRQQRRHLAANAAALDEHREGEIAPEADEPGVGGRRVA